MTEEDTSLVRILVCVILGASLIILGAENIIPGILMVGLGVLVVIYGFSPEAAESIARAVVDIATAPFKH